MTKKLEVVTYLKGWAILFIILTHSHQMFDLPIWAQLIPKFGRMGCQMFFVISCFCLCLSYEKSGGYILSFYKRRFKSIAVGYWITIFLGVSLALASIAIVGDNIFQTSIKPLEVLENVFLIHGLIPVGGGNNLVVRGGWYIGTIVVLYALFPFLYKGFLKMKNKQWYHYVVFVVCSFILVSLYLIDSRFRVNHGGYFYSSFVNQLPPFCIGFYIFYKYKNNIVVNSKRPLIIGCIAILISFIFYFIDTPVTYIIVPFLFSLGFAQLFLWLLWSYKESQETDRIRKIVLNYGNNSYAIYLIHVFLAFDLSSFVIYIFKLPHLLLYIIWLPLLYALIYLMGIKYNNIINSTQHFLESIVKR